MVEFYVHLNEQMEVDDGPRRLPRNWRNVSGLHLLDAAGKRSHGWWPCFINEPSFNPKTEKKGAISFVVNETSVSVSWPVVAQSQQELDAGLSSRQNKATDLRERLLAEANAVVTMLTAVKVATGFYPGSVTVPRVTAAVSYMHNVWKLNPDDPDNMVIPPKPELIP